jgi:hypothetical protein
MQHGGNGEGFAGFVTNELTNKQVQKNSHSVQGAHTHATGKTTHTQHKHKGTKTQKTRGTKKMHCSDTPSDDLCPRAGVDPLRHAPAHLAGQRQDAAGERSGGGGGGVGMGGN